MDRTRLQREEGLTFEFDHFDVPDISYELQMTSWHSKGLDHREKFRRTVAIYEAAIKYNWPLTNCIQSITELKQIVETWNTHQHVMRARKVIPLINT
jgi:hypothetical protein